MCYNLPKLDMGIELNRYTNCLEHRAFKGEESLGRRDLQTHSLLETLSSIDPFSSDYWRISNSKALRRLANKTQVFINPDHKHVRNRLSHTIEVEAVALSIATLTGLNKSLCQAIALGHDIGHVPYGHLGEGVLTELSGRKFEHQIFSVVLAQEIEKRGMGLNLTYETLRGILRHSGLETIPQKEGIPQEYQVVMFADKLAYLFADYEDAKRFEFLDPVVMDEMEKRVLFFGSKHEERTLNCMGALVEESAIEGTISFGKSEIAQAFGEFRGWMFREFYGKCNDLRNSQKQSLYDVYNFLTRAPYFQGCQPEVLLALMTDAEVAELVELIGNRYNPRNKDFERLSIYEIAPYIEGRKIDITRVDFSWVLNRKVDNI